MKLTKEQLRQIIKEEYQIVKESWQQGLFGGETEIVPPSAPKKQEPWQRLEDLTRATNKEFMELDLGLKMVRRLYKLHPNWAAETNLPKITQIIPMRGGTIEVVFSDGNQQVYQNKWDSQTDHRATPFHKAY